METPVKKKWYHNIKYQKGLWFHLIGIGALIWFLVRVVPAPHRAKYPCQQASLAIAVGYMAFWTGLFYVLVRWFRASRNKISKAVPSLFVIFLLMFSVSGMVFATQYYAQQTTMELSTTGFLWTPIPNEPIGTPKGANPGRVVWVWDPDATEKELTGFWWQTENNNQTVLDTMMADGLRRLAGTTTDTDAWDVLFHYFNTVHGNGDHGYQPGETIAIKINMNNGYFEDYTNEIDDVDANPFVVKALLRQLVNVAGVPQENIVVFDSSRKLMNWFYNRVYYVTYPADVLVPEFPGVHFVDSTGGETGREKVVASTEKVYFADGTCEYRTLPTVVTNATYLINMPITKRHAGDRVTLAGKNLFGTWVEPVVDVHEYNEIGYSQMGNPAPQVDLLGHQQLGLKTLLLIGDGTYACRYGNSDISKFQMYPFNNDWMSSLFFSQDAVAVDSVMYDFLYSEGTGPSEGAQNYIHQAAEPSANVYDPEHDGIFLSDSLGVHEHWNEQVDIFSLERYVGPSENGIDYIALGEEHAAPAITITKPLEKTLYLFGKELKFMPYMPNAIVIGGITVETVVHDQNIGVEKVEFYLDDKLQTTDTEAPYTWSWKRPSLFTHTISCVITLNNQQTMSDSMTAWKIL